MGSLGKGKDKISEDEIRAVDYWRSGKNGRAYLDIRQIVNKHKNPKDSNQEKIAHDFESAVQKSPSAENKILVRVAGDWRIPGQGEPKVGMKFSLDKLTSFSSTEPKNYNQLVENLGQGMKEEILFRIKGTSNFKDISNLGHSTAGTSLEKEVLTNSKSTYKITKITPVIEEGSISWLNPSGNQKYIIVDIEEVRRK